MFTRLRLSTALLHQFSGATLTMRRADGAAVTVGSHPSSDIDVCDFRRTLMSSPCPLRAEMAQRVVDADLGGTLVPERGDLYRVAPSAHQALTFATVLRPDAVTTLLETLDCQPADHVEAHLRPDPGLGITTVTIRSGHTSSRHDHLDHAARLAYEACLVEELLRDTP